MKIIRSIFVIAIVCCLESVCFGFGTLDEIPVPEGFRRTECFPGSFCEYMRHLPLKPDNTIYQWNKKKVFGFIYNVYAVVDKPLLFNSDLEQCADFCMRFWADYHKDMNRLDRLYLFDYSGSKKYFNDSGKRFESFLKWHMANSNSHSIKKGADIIEDDVFMPGDMFVQNKDGGIGHVSMIVDAAVDNDGQQIFLIGYGFIPAQEFHIEKAKNEYGREGWFTKEGYMKYLSEFPFSSYGEPVFRRFN